jgi:hypothetical protein
VQNSGWRARYRSLTGAKRRSLAVDIAEDLWLEVARDLGRSQSLGPQYRVNSCRVGTWTSPPANRGVPPYHPTCYLHSPSLGVGEATAELTCPTVPLLARRGMQLDGQPVQYVPVTPSPFSGVEGGNMTAAGTLQLHPSHHLPASPTPVAEGGSSRLTVNHHATFASRYLSNTDLSWAHVF